MFKGVLGGAIIIFSSGCGLIPETRPAGTIEPAFLPYVVYFADKAGENRVSIGDLYSLSVNMALDEHFSKDTVGTCQRNKNSQQIYIKKSYWDKASLSGREELIFHELGHCLLGMNHDTSIVQARDYSTGELLGYDLPASIMSPNVLWDKAYEQNREQYIKQLFRTLEIYNIYIGGPSQINPNQYKD